MPLDAMGRVIPGSYDTQAEFDRARQQAAMQRPAVPTNPSLQAAQLLDQQQRMAAQAAADRAMQQRMQAAPAIPARPMQAELDRARQQQLMQAQPSAPLPPDAQQRMAAMNQTGMDQAAYDRQQAAPLRPVVPGNPSPVAAALLPGRPTLPANPVQASLTGRQQRVFDRTGRMVPAAPIRPLNGVVPPMRGLGTVAGLTGR